MELLILIDALKRGSANSVTVVVPYFGYERQDRKDYSRAPISARIIASCLETMNIDRLITFDLHAGQIQGFFSCNTPVDNLYIESYFIKYINSNIIKNKNRNKIVIVSPDEGSVKRASRISNKLSVATAIIYKERKKHNEVALMKLMGDVNNKICILVDDMIDTAGTACKASELLYNYGASEIYMLSCHGLFSKDAINNICNSKFTKVIVSNTLDQSIHINKINDCNCMNKIDYIDVSEMCAEAMKRSNNGASISELYN